MEEFVSHLSGLRHLIVRDTAEKLLVVRYLSAFCQGLVMLLSGLSLTDGWRTNILRYS